MVDESIIKFPDMLRIKGVMAKGYGIICKFPMTDPDLKVNHICLPVCIYRQWNHSIPFGQ